MRKYIIEAIVLSALIGIVLRASVLLFRGEHLWTNGESYLFSALIAMLSCSLSIFIHVKVLASNTYSTKMKMFLSSLLILIIYGMGNVAFGGFDILFRRVFYLYGLVIVVVTLPLLYYLNQKIQLYNQFLAVKKSRARKTE
ncbi:hypothetical protein [Marinicrinis sediminis]|uniref:DUF3021 family protein n=1 Tax=Marinicrinis sediminis TaxID=1652465 RepID=A0ABW5RC65_9BACL